MNASASSIPAGSPSSRFSSCTSSSRGRSCSRRRRRDGRCGAAHPDTARADGGMPTSTSRLASSSASAPPMLCPNSTRRASTSGSTLAMTWSASAPIVRNGGSRKRAPRPGSSTAHTSTSSGNPACQCAYAEALPPAYEQHTSRIRGARTGMKTFNAAVGVMRVGVGRSGSSVEHAPDAYVTQASRCAGGLPTALPCAR